MQNGKAGFTRVSRHRDTVTDRCNPSQSRSADQGMAQMKRIGGLVLAFALVVGLGAGGGLAQPASEAETIFWNRVKDSGKAPELRAYLDAFPNGAYADLARSRLQSLLPSRPMSVSPQPAPSRPSNAGPQTGGPSEPAPRTASPQPVTPPSGGGPSSPSEPPAGVVGSVLYDAGTLQEVQERFYNLNYDLAITGRLDEATRKAVRDWQTNTRRPVTGDMDADGLQALRNARMPANWGALAYVARGASAVVWSRTSRGQAERDAIAGCQKNGGRGCKVVTAADQGCGALGWYQGRVRSTTHWGAYAVVRQTLAQAIEGALSECRSQARTPEACGVRLQFCADGGHTR